jgi:S-DNA-T family DNA segregation ATPase FtsK/SpoIIIE
MAENTFKNAPKPKGKKSAQPEAPEPKSRFQWPAFTEDNRVRLIFGLVLMLFALVLALAMISYLFSGKHDQSVLSGLGQEDLNESGKEVRNWLGIVGAWFAHGLMYKGFGVASLLFAPIVFAPGYKLFFGKYPFPMPPLLIHSAFFIVWLPSFLGYIVSSFGEGYALSTWCGYVGYQMGAALGALLGWGTILLSIASLGVYVLFTFNLVGQVQEWSKQANIKKQEEDLQLETELEEDEIEEPEAEVELELSDWDIRVRESENVLVEKEEKPPLFPDTLIEIHQYKEEERIPEAKNHQEPAKDIIHTSGLEMEVEVPQDEIPTTEGKIENYDPTLDLASYQYPNLALLDEYDHSKVLVSAEELKSNAQEIQKTLQNFSIEIISIKATVGPTVTLYEIIPAPGTRIAKIKNLEDDIALSLAALGIRIIAPIPGKGTIGIEVPNKQKEMVSGRALFSSEKFTKNDKDLPIAFGKTITNEVFVVDLASMPHLLVAGATGQGKSVGLNIIITSLLFRKHPSQLKFVLIDPKKVELTLYSKIEKHFLAKLPDTEEAIITDNKKVIHTLNSLCIEMDNRYLLLKEAGCRNLKEYNHKFVERRLSPLKGHRFLPYIVVVIDELADLMITAGKEVETPIARLAQLARAIGIHLVVATQRPSVNVITGVIKANFPARLSFRVSSKIDSRTILDAGGADQLIGKGDMLYLHGSDMVRIQCGFVDTPEVDRICEFIGNQRGYEMAYKLPEYVDEDAGGGNSDIDLSKRDSLFEEAARMIVSSQMGSASLLQRKMQLGYNRAGRLIDQMEAAGIVGPAQGSKPREVLIYDMDSLEHILKNLNERK